MCGVSAQTQGSNPPPHLVKVDPFACEMTDIAEVSQGIGVIGSILWNNHTNLFLGTGFGGPLGNIFFDLDPQTAVVSNIRASENFVPQGMAFVQSFTPLLG